MANVNNFTLYCILDFFQSPLLFFSFFRVFLFLNGKIILFALFSISFIHSPLFTTKRLSIYLISFSLFIPLCALILVFHEYTIIIQTRHKEHIKITEQKENLRNERKRLRLRQPTQLNGKQAERIVKVKLYRKKKMTSLN